MERSVGVCYAAECSSVYVCTMCVYLVIYLPASLLAGWMYGWRFIHRLHVTMVQSRSHIL